MMQAHEIEDIEVDLFLEAVFRRYGYDFRDYSKASMKRRVMRLLSNTGHASVSAMIPELMRDEEFFSLALKTFSIGVTEMFRDPAFFRVIREEVIPHLKTFPFIKIWHAGCATGEEVYSMAIVLKEEGLYERATIFATDMNQESLAAAKGGIYPLESLRTSTLNYQKAGGAQPFTDYYHADYASGILNSGLKKNITFAQHNLATDSSFGDMHLIVCRNVLIYFNRELQRRVLTLFNDSLITGGILALGSKESIADSAISAGMAPLNPKWRVFHKRFAPLGKEHAR